MGNSNGELTQTVLVDLSRSQCDMPWPTVLHKYIAEESDDIWSAVMQRASSHPEEVSVQGAGYGQTALHAACYRYPPEHAIRVLLNACPGAAAVQNSDGETALHLASDGASEEVQMMLLEAYPMAVSKVDKYGDSPLHLAAHTGCSTPLLRRMLEASPKTAMVFNKREATPFFLISRSYEYIRSRDEIEEDGEYFDEWERVIMFLKASFFGTLKIPEGKTFTVLHAAAKVMCPRALFRVITRLFPEQAIQRDENGCTPLALAASASVFEEPDIEDADGFDHHHDDYNVTGHNNNLPLEHIETNHRNGNGSIHNNFNAGGNENLANANGRIFHSSSLSYENGEHERLLGQLSFPSNASLLNQSTCAVNSPNVVALLNDQSSKTSAIDILVGLNPRAARIRDFEGRLPFVRAIESGKLWNEGLRSLLWAAPQALSTRDFKTRMYPFMIAAVEHNATETTVYEIIRLLPELVAIGIPQDDFIKTPLGAAVTNKETMKNDSTEKQTSQSKSLQIRTKKLNEESSSTFLKFIHPIDQKYKKRKRNLNQTSDEIVMTSKRYENSNNCRSSSHVISECISHHK